MTATVSADGKLANPEELRLSKRFGEGTQFEVVLVGETSLLLKKAVPQTAPKPGSMARWLCSCPEKNWFKEPDRSELLDVPVKSLFDQ